MNERLTKARLALEQADYVLVGAGAGCSAAAGLTYDGARFTENFAPFIAKYGMTDMYSAGFYPFPGDEEKWAYWAKHILLNRYEAPPAPLYRDLLRLVEHKNYFVITTNVDGQFALTGFPEEALFATQGDYRYFQCAAGCHDGLYDNERAVRAMAAYTDEALRIPAALVPTCPVCGGRMEVHLRCGDSFVQNAAWYEAQKRYEQFIKRTSGRRLVLLELGVGFNTPGIIRFPFEQMACQTKEAVLLRLNRDPSGGAPQNRNKTIVFQEDMEGVIRALWTEKNS